MAALEEAARIAVRDALSLRPGEEVLIVTNFQSDVFSIARALFAEAKAGGGNPTLLVQGTKEPYMNIERLVNEAIRAEPHVLILLPAISSGTDAFGLQRGYLGRDGRLYRSLMYKLLEGDRRMRGFWSNRVSADTFSRCVAVDYAPMRRDAAMLKRALDRGRTVRVTSPAGTDVEFSIKGRRAYKEDGDFSLPGTGGNLPSGEVYISPAVASAHGTIVFDGTMGLEEGDIFPAGPVRVDLREGYISSITGGLAAARLRRAIESSEGEALVMGLHEERRNARHIGEFGIGLNPNAMLVGNMIEDEKALGTAHFAVGNNFEDDAPALIHQDCLLLSPSIWVDGRRIMKDGELVRGGSSLNEL